MADVAGELDINALMEWCLENGHLPGIDDPIEDAELEAAARDYQEIMSGGGPEGGEEGGGDDGHDGRPHEEEEDEEDEDEDEEDFDLEFESRSSSSSESRKVSSSSFESSKMSARRVSFFAAAVLLPAAPEAFLPRFLTTTSVSLSSSLSLSASESESDTISFLRLRATNVNASLIRSSETDRREVYFPGPFRTACFDAAPQPMARSKGGLNTVTLRLVRPPVATPV